MNESIATQIYILLIFLITGIVIGILFDIFRVLRKSFKTTNTITYIEDILFWVLSAVIFIIVLYITNNGQIRNYVIIGLLLGVITYLLLISKYFIRINVAVISYLKRIIGYPFKKLSFIVINIRKVFWLNKNRKTKHSKNN